MFSEELRWINSYLVRHPVMYFLMVVGSIVEIMLFSSPTLFVAKLIDLFLRDAPPEEVVWWIFFFLSIFILQALTFYGVATLNEILAHRVTTDMTADLFVALQNRPLYYHDHVKIGDIMARATGDTRTINIGLSPVLRILIQIVTLLIGSLVLFVNINLKLSLILFASFPLYAYFVYTYSKKLGPESTEIRRSFGDLSVTTHELLRGVHELKSYTYEDNAVQYFSTMSQRHAGHIRRFGVLSSVYPPQFIIALSLGLVAIYGVILMDSGELSFPEFVIFVGIVSILQFLSRRIKFISSIAVRMVASAKRVREMICADVPPLKYGDEELLGLSESIEFTNVSFRYSEDREWALRSVSLRINQGETIAVVGGPGSGKSTLTKLLLRLYDPQEGQISLDGKDIRSYSHSSLRRELSSIEQDVFLFSTTIRENIAFGRPQATIEEVIQAAKYARAHDFISGFKDGYETVIGERGVTLSGGQKQRIAIARALLMNPSILIMDDASSALDAETESQIQSAIKYVLHTRTSIVITHRLSIIAEADRVVVLHRGKVVAEGTHRSLLRRSVYYRRLFESNYELPELEVSG